MTPLRGDLTSVEAKASAKAMVIDDLAKTIAVGGRLHFRNERFRFEYEGDPQPIKNWADFHGTLLMVHIGDEADQHILGSGVLIGPGVALTARHVVEEHVADIAAGSKGVMCSGVVDHGLILWRPRAITTFDNTDIAIMTMECCSESPPDYAFTVTTLTTRLPPVGERLCLAGFRMSESVSRFEKRGALYLASGKVLAQYPLGRDRTMLPWPVLEVDTPALGGVSGGAVFDANGAVCALITSSFPDGPSYASLIWPTLQTAINQPWPPGAFPAPETLIEFGAPLVSIDGPEAVTIAQHPETGIASTAYEPWS